MKRILKHTIFLLCFLASTAQVVHLSAHVFNSHPEDDQAETVHLVDDHKCTICTSLVFSSLPNTTDFIFEIPLNFETKQQRIIFKNLYFKTIDLKHFYLRGPPVII